MKPHFLLLFAVTSMLFIACEDDDNMTIDIDEPATYAFERDGASTVSFSGQTARLAMAEELISAMKDFSVSEQTMLEMYANQDANGGDVNPFSDPALNAETKSVRSKVAASADFFSSNTAGAATVKAKFEEWISAQVSEVFPNENVLAEEGVAGQIADGSSTRYVSGKGLEYNQAVNKGLIGAIFADQIVNNYVSVAVLDAGDNIIENDNGTVAADKSYTTMEHKWDEAYGYLFGLSPDAAAANLTIGDDDSFLNKYFGRVESDPDFAGIADDVYNAFKLGRAAIVAGDYKVRDEQAAIIRDKVSTVIAVRAVYYLQQGKNGLESSPVDYGAAFHDLSEGFGFIYSLQFTRKSDTNAPYFTAAEVDGFLNDLLEGNGFWDVTPATLNAMSETIAAKFDFTVAQAGE
ncbi:MAG: DUF4856 domain-containing protein [Bacteroidota bacterium]